MRDLPAWSAASQFAAMYALTLLMKSGEEQMQEAVSQPVADAAFRAPACTQDGRVSWARPRPVAARRARRVEVCIVSVEGVKLLQFRGSINRVR